MGMLIHRRGATEVKKGKTTTLDDVTPVEKPDEIKADEKKKSAKKVTTEK